MIRRKKDIPWFLDEIHEARKNRDTGIALALIASVLCLASIISGSIIYRKRR